MRRNIMQNLIFKGLNGQFKIEAATQYITRIKDSTKKLSGPVFRKGLRLSQVIGLNPVLKLRLLSQLSFVLKLYSQRVT